MTTHIIRRVSNEMAMPHPETASLIQYGLRRGWPLAILGMAPMLEEPVRLKDWLLVPAHMDSSHTPARALKRVQSLYAAGIRPQGFVVVHEAPLALPSGKPTPKVNPLPIGNIEFEDAAADIGKAIGVLAAGAFAVIGLALMSTLAVGALVLDPILIAVTQDNYWVEIDRWNA